MCALDESHAAEPESFGSHTLASSSHMGFPTSAVVSALATFVASTLVAWPAVKPWIERLVDRRLDFEFARKLATHKQELDVLTENARYDFQKKLANVSLHTTRRHSAYSDAYREARIAHGLIVSLRGTRTVPTFEDYNTNDVTAYLARLEAPKGFTDEICTQWGPDRTGAVERHQPYVRKLEEQSAENAFINARNTVFTNELYFSDAVVERCNAFVEAGATALAEGKVGSTATEWPRVNAAFTSALDDLHEAMRSELAEN